jgi:hypothetical protein
MIDAATVGLPRRDVRIAGGAMLLMLLADIAAADLSPEVRRLWPLLIIMPGSLALIWACYGLSLWFIRKAPDAHRAAALMGLTLAMMAVVMGVAHGGLVAGFSHHLSEGRMDLILRLFLVSLGVVVLLTYNRIAKLIPGHLATAGGRWNRRFAVLGVVSAAGMIGLGLFGPLGRMMPAFLVLAFAPSAVLAGGWLMVWLDSRRAG